MKRLLVSRGVKQGDPPAMVLCIFAYDPVIRFIDNCLSIENTSPLGYCDDLGFTCMDVAADWAIIKKCFIIIIERATLLHLNLDKNQCLLSSLTNFEAEKDRLLASDPDILADQVSQKLKYLGITLGLNASDDNWATPLKKYVD